ncbi:MAG: helix-turn-helix domain-containing protein, partial [Synergistaceae bacterium]|nr:helix-turn-helix domain-containing protein [Synergistaceae bacterium]
MAVSQVYPVLDFPVVFDYYVFIIRIKNPWSETTMENGNIRVISRAFSILVHLAQEKRSLGITEIASAVSLPK